MKTPFRLTCLLFLALALLLCFSQQVEAQTKQKPSQTQEKYVRITAVSGNQITVSETAGGGGGGRNTQGSSSGRGRRGRGRMQGGSAQTNQKTATLTIGADVRITMALQERRTNEFKVGADINGRLRNELFRRIPAGGLSARLVAQGNRLVAVNVIQANDTSLEDIAVKPKRPPRRK